MSVTWSPKHYGYRVAKKVGEEFVVKYFEACPLSEVAALETCSPTIRELLEERIRVGKEIAYRDATAFEEELNARKQALKVPRKDLPLPGESPIPERPAIEGPDQVFPIEEVEGLALLFSASRRSRWSFVVGKVESGIPEDALLVGFERTNVASRLEIAVKAWSQGKQTIAREAALSRVRLINLVRFLKSVDPHF
jgi:hypothetical protein